MGIYLNVTRSTRKPTLWTLRNVSTRISLGSPRKLIRADSFRLRRIEIYSNDSCKQKIQRRRKLTDRLTLRGMLKLIRLNTLRRVHNVDFHLERLFFRTSYVAIKLGDQVIVITFSKVVFSGGVQCVCISETIKKT